MARIRSIKPEFWTNGKVLECSPIARLMFIGMWNFADDKGHLPYSTRTLKAQIFPGDDLGLDAIAAMVDELSGNGLVSIYIIDDKPFLEICGWKHQKIDKPQPPKYPAPSANTPRMVSTDRIREERMGEEGKSKKDAAGAAADAALLKFPQKEKSPTDRPKENRVGEPDDVALYREGKALLGKSAGGMIRKLLAAKNGNVALARAAVLQASTKDDAREYIGAIINGRDRDEMGALQPGYGDDFM